MDPRVHRDPQRNNKGGGPTPGQVVTFLLFTMLAAWALFGPRGG